jgi:hypothetical protein
MAIRQVVGGNPYISTDSKNPYQDIYNQYAKAQESVKAQDQKAWEQRRAEDTAKVNGNYDSSSRQNYLNYMQQQKALPSQLAKLGVNGGANETAMLRLNTAYGNNVANNESARNSALSSVNTNYENEWNDYMKNYNQNLADALSQAQENDVAYQRELQERDLQQFSASITGRFRTRAGYKNLIAILRKSSDPNKKYKIALAQQAMNALDDTATSGGSGSGYSSYGSYGSYGSSGGGNGNNGNGSRATSNGRGTHYNSEYKVKASATNPFMKYSPKWYQWEQQHR